MCIFHVCTHIYPCYSAAIFNVKSPTRVHTHICKYVGTCVCIFHVCMHTYARYSAVTFNLNLLPAYVCTSNVCMHTYASYWALMFHVKLPTRVYTHVCTYVGTCVCIFHVCMHKYASYSAVIFNVKSPTRVYTHICKTCVCVRVHIPHVHAHICELLSFDVQR